MVGAGFHNLLHAPFLQIGRHRFTQTEISTPVAAEIALTPVNLRNLRLCRTNREEEAKDLTALTTTLFCTQYPAVQSDRFIAADQVRKTTSVRCKLSGDLQHLRRDHVKPPKWQRLIPKRQRVNGVTYILKIVFVSHLASEMNHSYSL